MSFLRSFLKTATFSGVKYLTHAGTPNYSQASKATKTVATKVRARSGPPRWEQLAEKAPAPKVQAAADLPDLPVKPGFSARAREVTKNNTPLTVFHRALNSKD